ncbi:hypothetical protein NKDENANG_00365 [Candidatus Entotheonellaceae bacterium PAL068K]
MADLSGRLQECISTHRDRPNTRHVPEGGLSATPPFAKGGIFPHGTERHRLNPPSLPLQKGEDKMIY